MHEIILIGFFISILLIFIWNLFSMERIDWVHRERMKILNNHKKSIEERLKDYRNLVSFDEMIRKFWIWDIDKFKK